MSIRPRNLQRPPRLGAWRPAPDRTGTILPGLVVALVVTLCAVALVLDRLWLDAATTELRTASDAAAMAAAGELIHDDLLKEAHDPAARVEAARQKAKDVAGQNLVAGEPVELDATPEGDVRFGRFVRDEDEDIVRFLETESCPRTVRVRATRLRARGNPIALFFRGLTGQSRGDACSQSEVTANNEVLGVRPFDGVPVPAMPLAILKCDPSGLRNDTWERHIENRCGCDEYRWNSETNTVEPSHDGIPEIELHSKKQDETALETNVQLLDLNSDLRTEKLARQFRTGWTAEDLKDYGAELVFHQGTHWMTSSATIDSDHASSLEDIIGQQRICLLYSELVPSGRDGYGNLRVTDLVAGRIMAVRQTSEGQHILVFQPTVITTRTAVLADTVMEGMALTPAERKLLENSYIYKLHLTR